MYVRFGGWLDGMSGFDAAAFRLSARCALAQSSLKMLVLPLAAAAVALALPGS
jgi:acyl transferase domain-containing protein